MAVNDLSEREERPAYVQFERVAKEDKVATLAAGRSISVDVDYALITPPYSRDCVRMTIKRWKETNQYEARQGRLPDKWVKQWDDAYEAWKNGEEIPLDGTPIKEWSAISPAQIKNLIAIGILTVEDLAQANDQGISRIGMGAQELKRKAQNWLSAANDGGKIALKITQLETDKERDALTIESLTEKVKQLASQVEAMGNTAPIDNTVVVPHETITADDIMPENARAVNYKGMGKYELIEAHKVRFGKAPDGRMKEETIRQKLEE